MADENVFSKIIDLDYQIQIYYKSLNLFVIIDFWNVEKNTSYSIFNIKNRKHYEGDSSYAIDFNDEFLDKINFWKKLNIIQEDNDVKEIIISNPSEVIKMLEFDNEDLNYLELCFSNIYYMTKDQQSG